MDAATINVRMSDELKRGGGQVLERKRVSPTEVVRSLYRYLKETQEIPACLDVAQEQGQTVYQKRRLALRAVAGAADIPAGYDAKADRAARIEGKYGDLL